MPKTIATSILTPPKIHPTIVPISAGLFRGSDEFVWLVEGDRALDGEEKLEIAGVTMLRQFDLTTTNLTVKKIPTEI